MTSASVQNTFTATATQAAIINVSAHKYATISINLSCYAVKHTTSLNLEGINMTSHKANSARLEKFKSLNQKGWNGYDSDPIKLEAIKNAAALLEALIVQPKVFPLPNGNIQLEYYNRKNTLDYLEFEVSETFIADETEGVISVERANEILRGFYGLA